MQGIMLQHLLSVKIKVNVIIDSFGCFFFYFPNQMLDMSQLAISAASIKNSAESVENFSKQN
jgi:hypothetical protein